MTVHPQEASSLVNGIEISKKGHANNSIENGVSESAVLYSNLSDQPPKALSSKGCWIISSDGMDVFDASSGAAVACIGHDNPRVKAAVMRQLDNIAYCYAPFFTTEPVENLARELSDSTGGQMSRAFIVSSGAHDNPWDWRSPSHSHARR